MTGAAAGPLGGITVLDLCSYLAGPYGCTLLADLGASVIKIESPQEDMLRQFPSSLAGESRCFLGTNCGKRALALDLKQPEGLAVLHRLVKTADVLVENFRPSVPARLGIDYPPLKAINPRLIYCGLTGYGNSGPLSEKGAGPDLWPTQRRDPHQLWLLGQGDRRTAPARCRALAPAPVAVKEKETSMPRLAGKVAFITGAGSGIGRATAILFASEGAKVAIAEIDARAGEETAHLAGNDAIAICADVTDPDSLQAAIRTTVDKFGRLDVLHNNAGGSTARDNTAVDAPLDEFWRAIKLDLYGTFLGCRFGIPELIKAGGGSVINMSSNVALMGVAGRDCYTAAKGGIAAITRSPAGRFMSSFRSS
jgi:hypothetical protein